MKGGRSTVKMKRRHPEEEGTDKNKRQNAKQHGIHSLRRHPAPPTASTVQEKLECSICQDDLRNSENSNRPTTLPCYHTFHVTCIQPWLELSETCPIWYFIQKINGAKTAY